METRHRRSHSSGDSSMDLNQIAQILKQIQTSSTSTNLQLENLKESTNATIQQLQVTNVQLESLKASIGVTIEAELAKQKVEVQRQRTEDLEKIIVVLEQKLQQSHSRVDQETQEKINVLKEEIQQDKELIHERIQHVEEVTEQVQNDIDGLKHRTDSTYEKMGRVEQKTADIDDNLAKETTGLRDMILALQIKEQNKFDAIEEKMTELRKTEKNVIYGTSHQANPLLKPEKWPKYKGTNDIIHPMMYLKTIISDRCQTIQQFEEEFRKQYWSTLHQDRQMVKLITGKYTKEGSLNRENYACELFNKCKYIPGLTEQKIAGYLLHHFILSDNQSIVCQDVQDMEQLMGILRRLDNLTSLQMSQSYLQNQRPYNNNHTNNSSYINTRSNYNNYSQNQNYQRYQHNQQNHYNRQNSQHSDGNYNNYQQRNNYSWQGNPSGHQQNQNRQQNQNTQQNRNCYQRNYQNTSQPRSTRYNAYERQNNEYYGRKHTNPNTTQSNPPANVNVSWKDRQSGQNENAAYNTTNEEQNSPQIHENGKKNADFKSSSSPECTSRIRLDTHTPKDIKPGYDKPKLDTYPRFYDNIHNVINTQEQEDITDEDENIFASITIDVGDTNITAIVDTAAEISLIHLKTMESSTRLKQACTSIKKISITSTNGKKLGEITHHRKH
ncbi:hypothetical protein QE152_g4306 [Popillia japonica]|uniref:Peptidase A2 domain-containing protein n=1 Tax=Popillia japonica TaxID=7064 RepID=A0AAW1MWI0_POPJA